MESILRLEIAVEPDHRVLQLVYRFALLVHRAAQLAQQLLAVQAVRCGLVVGEKPIWHEMLILHDLMILLQPLSPVGEILANRLLALFQFLSLPLHSRPLVLIALSHHGELLLCVLDALFDFGLLGKQILLCIAISDHVGALSLNFLQQSP